MTGKRQKKKNHSGKKNPLYSKSKIFQDITQNINSKTLKFKNETDNKSTE